MKKYSMILGAALSIFALVSCQKEVDTPKDSILPSEKVGSVPFVLNASIAETKTTLDLSTWAVNWEDGNIIYAVTTDEEWGVAYSSDKDAATVAEFSYDNSSSIFTTTSTISDGNHTFNFLYTNGTQKSYHRGASTTHSLPESQTFDASNPTANLKAYDVLAGQKEFTTPTSLAGVTMSHIYTLMKVTLKNKTGNAVEINRFDMSVDSGTYLYGIYDVTFGATPSAAWNKNGGNSLTVNISNGAIANDGNLDVYFVIPALSSYTGDITFTAYDTAGNSYTKTNSVTSLSFAAGSFNTANFTMKSAAVDYVTLDWNYAGGTSSDLNDVVGVTTSGLGSDYTSHYPYCVKFDNSGDYIQVKTDAAISTVSVDYKMIGGANNSYLNIFESTDGNNWGERIDRLTISGTQNSTGTLTTTATFNTSSRFVKIVFEKGSNVGIGALSITKASTDPVILANDINNVPAAGVSAESATYTVKNFADDVEVDSYTGCVTDATASDGDIIYDVTPNYESDPQTGTIVLHSAGNGTITKTINVNQLGSSLTVSKTEVVIPSDSDDAMFTITSPDFDWSISADDDSHILYDDSGTADASPVTVNVSSDVEATDAVQTIATLTVIRNSNSSDPQKKEIVVKKAAKGEKSYTITWNSSNNSNAVQDYVSTWSVTSDGLTCSMTNFNNNQNGWDYVKCGRKNNASVATIISPAIAEAIKTVTLTIDALTASKINSIKLYSSSDNSNWTEEGSYTKATGNQTVTIASPTASKYYKLEFDCASGSSNGLLTLSKIVYSTK